MTTSERVWDGRGDRLADARMSWIAGRAADDLRLTGLHWRILAYVGRQNCRRGWLRLAQTELAEAWGVHRKSLNRAIKELVSWGYLKKQSQADTGESFCHYKVCLDDGDEPDQAGGVPHTGGTPQKGGVPHTGGTPQAGGVPHTGGTPSGGGVPHICGTSAASRGTPIVPTYAELPPNPREAGGQSGSSVSWKEGVPVKQAAWLETLRSELEHQAFVALFEPLLTSRRWSSATPLDDLREAARLAKGLPRPALETAWRVLRDSGVATIKPARLKSAIEAGRKGGAMVVIRPGSPQWDRWLEHFEATDGRQAKTMAKAGVWQVRAEWPPSRAGTGGAP